MAKTKFGIIGGGWRADFFLRVAREMPDRFNVSGMLVRDEKKAKLIEEKWGVKTFRFLDKLINSCDFLFLVVSVSCDAAPRFILELSRKDIPVLSETPPASEIKDLTELNKLVKPGAKIQIAEQLIFQPFHTAVLSVIESGKLGNISQAQISVAHGYHGLNLIRRMLGISFENVSIYARNFTSPIIKSPGREGPPSKKEIVDSEQVIAYLDFGKKLGIYDFTGDLYFSWIRRPRILIRGEKGEINNTHVSYLKDFKTPAYFDLRRIDTGKRGNLEGYYLKGIMGEGKWIYKNPFAPARLSDDEIAVAVCLAKMEKYVRKGISFYDLAEASQDRYLDIMINKAVREGKETKTSSQIWVS